MDSSPESRRSATSSPRVFVSHSSRDREGRLFVHDLFDGSRFRPDFYPVRNDGPPHARPIAGRIASSASLFLLLSKDLASRTHTRAWVGFEVGIATAHDIPVVVVEPDGQQIDLPIPGATHYIRRPKELRMPLSPEWVKLLTTGGMLKESEPTSRETTLGGRILEALSNAAASGYDVTHLFKKAVCEAPNCRSPFWVPDSIFGSQRVPCPTCRHLNASFRVSLLELAEDVQKRQLASKPDSAMDRADED